MLGLTDLLMNLALAVFIGVRAESLTAAIVYLLCYWGVTYLFYRGEENHKGSHAYLAMWGMKEGITALVAALISKLVIGVYDRLANGVSKGHEIIYLDADSMDRSSSNEHIVTLMDELSGMYHQLVAYCESVGLTEVDQIVYLYLAIKGCWICVKAYNYALHAHIVARMKTA